MLAIIGGTGLTQLPDLEITRRQVMRTPYGEPSGALTFGKIHNHEVVFLARHGYGHTIAPHEVNYRANLWALHSAGVGSVIAVNSVGGIHPDLTPGAVAIPEQIIDYTHGRKSTYFEGSDKPVTHVDFTHPYSEDLRARLIQAAQNSAVPIVPGGVYAAVQGPRLETLAEINRLERDGASMVGMTGMPEAALARELGLSYAALAVVSNSAAGRGASLDAVHLDTIHTALDAGMAKVRNIIEQVVNSSGG